jgi:two-component system sensor histidine kinase HydH
VREPVDVNAIARDAAGAARDAFSTPVDLRLRGDSPVVFGDPLAIRRILDNVVTNAAQSIEDGRGLVTITTDCRNGVALIRVSDNGRGMTPDEVSRALSGFYTTKPHGTGLGLSVVRRLVADHGGSVHVQSTPGGGTVVSIEIPAQVAAHQPRILTRS